MSNYVEPHKKGKRITKADRNKIEVMYKHGYTHKQMADEIGVSRPAISKEIKKGLYECLDKEYRTITLYSAYIAQQHHELASTSHGLPIKLGKNHDYLIFIEKQVIENNCSFDAAISNAKKEGFTFSLSRTTLYNSFNHGYFLHLKKKHFPMPRKKRNKSVKKTAKQCRLEYTSIDRRKKDIENRQEIGHWEMDCVIGKAKGKSRCLLVLSERKTRQEICLVMKEKTATETVRNLNVLHCLFGDDFYKLFKTITVDNGPEFSNEKGMRQDKQIEVFHCHPYSSWERGTNENTNKLVRRKIPKGTSMQRLTSKQSKIVQDWINNYPRPIFGGKTSNEVFFAELQQLALKDPQNIMRFFNYSGNFNS